jgi:NADH-quinone oxidoreductase subunit E
MTAISFSNAIIDRFAQEVAKFPSNQRQSAVMACLAIIQKEQGWVSPQAQEAVAVYLDMPVMAVHEVVTFYNMYNKNPVGLFKLNVCTNLPCQLRGGQDALGYLKKRLGIEEGETTIDGRFTLQAGECLGACADAPVMIVNDFHMCSLMSPDRIDLLIDDLGKELKT